MWLGRRGRCGPGPRHKTSKPRPPAQEVGIGSKEETLPRHAWPSVLLLDSSPSDSPGNVLDSPLIGVASTTQHISILRVSAIHGLYDGCFLCDGVAPKGHQRTETMGKFQLTVPRSADL